MKLPIAIPDSLTTLADASARDQSPAYLGALASSLEEVAREIRAHLGTQETKRVKEEIQHRAHRRLTGTAGDLTADMFGTGPTPLFDRIRS